MEETNSNFFVTIYNTFHKHKIFQVEVSPNDTISILKDKITEFIKINVKNDYVYLNKVKLLDTTKISDLSLKIDDKFMLVKNFT